MSVRQLKSLGDILADMTRSDHAESPLEDALHALAQPLTALSFLLELGRRQSDPQVWRSTLDDALQECKRAVAALEKARAIVLERGEHHL